MNNSCKVQNIYVSCCLKHSNIVATGQSQEERAEGDTDEGYFEEYGYEYVDYNDYSEEGEYYDIPSPPPTLSQLVPPTQSLEELLPKGTLIET